MAITGHLHRLLSKDPLWTREWRASSRLPRTPWALAATSLAMTGLLFAVGAGQSSMSFAADIGQALFHAYVGTSILFVTLVGPAIAASSVALEREGRTWEALVMAGLSPSRLDRGKFLGAYSHLCLYVFALIPAAGLPLLYGGVSHREVLLGVTMVFVAGALAVRFGLLLSAAVASSRTALLTTVLASSLLALGVASLGFGVGRWLVREVFQFFGNSDDIVPVFWPLAMTRAAVNLDYVRYLVVAPLAGVGLAWVVMRELTLWFLTPAVPGARARLRLTFAAATPVIGVVLGLMPRRQPSEVFALLGAMAAYAFGALLVLGGRGGPGSRFVRTPGAILKSSLLVVGVASLGLVLIPIVANVVSGIASLRPLADGESCTTDHSYSVRAMLFYAPSFLLFLSGAYALLEVRLPSVSAPRVALLGIAFAAAVGPVVLSMLLRLANDGERVDAPAAFSPFAVLGPLYIGWELVRTAAFTWALLGVVLLGVAAALARPSAAASRQVRTPI